MSSGRFRTPIGYDPSLAEAVESQSRLYEEMGFEEASLRMSQHQQVQPSHQPLNQNSQTQHQHNLNLLQARCAELEDEVSRLQKELKQQKDFEQVQKMKLESAQQMQKGQMDLFKEELVKQRMKNRQLSVLVNTLKGQCAFYKEHCSQELPENLTLCANAFQEIDEDDVEVLVLDVGKAADLQKENEQLTRKLKQIAQAYQQLQKQQQQQQQQQSAATYNPHLSGSPPVSSGPATPAVVGVAKNNINNTYGNVDKNNKPSQQFLEFARSSTKSIRKDLSKLQKLHNAGMSHLWQVLMEKVLPVINRFGHLQSQLARETALRRVLHDAVQALRGNVRVMVRVRPQINDEKELPTAAVAFNEQEAGVVDVQAHAQNKIKKWSFDRVFGPQSKQEDIFDELHPLVLSTLDGYSVCVFAYGQTGSGKTFTMQGNSSTPGVYSHTFESLFDEVYKRGSQTKVFLSVVEIYLDQTKDLLADVKKNETGATKDNSISTNFERYSNQPTQIPLDSAQAADEYLLHATAQRAQGTTNMNEHSSRSHLIVTLSIRTTLTTEQADQLTKQSQKVSRYPLKIVNNVLCSDLHLVDLAGSERLQKSGVSGQRAREAVAINSSLSALGDVFSALLERKPHIPYRNSLLTQVLQDSLGGDAKTLMLLQVSPAHYDESLNSLTFAARVANVTKISE